ncbi:MAG: hypothetical protein KAW40_02940 [Candidatus Aenigmarchaeota archaeon]|nr:hypothetical protein [Candidatus Aenigmarchaeota archaeon]
MILPVGIHEYFPILKTYIIAPYGIIERWISGSTYEDHYRLKYGDFYFKAYQRAKQLAKEKGEEDQLFKELHIMEMDLPEKELRDVISYEKQPEAVVEGGDNAFKRLFSKMDSNLWPAFKKKDTSSRSH